MDGFEFLLFRIKSRIEELQADEITRYGLENVDSLLEELKLKVLVNPQLKILGFVDHYLEIVEVIINTNLKTMRIHVDNKYSSEGAREEIESELVGYKKKLIEIKKVAERNSPNVVKADFKKIQLNIGAPQLAVLMRLLIESEIIKDRKIIGALAKAFSLIFITAGKDEGSQLSHSRLAEIYSQTDYNDYKILKPYIERLNESFQKLKS